MKPGPRILVVDDDPGVLRALRGLLGDEGFTPVEARSAAEASRRSTSCWARLAVVVSWSSTPWKAASTVRR